MDAETALAMAARTGDCRIGEHFTLLELVDSPTARRDPDLWRAQRWPAAGVVGELIGLARTLDAIRGLVECPVHVNSGFRCRALNQRIGGAARSLHLAGRAADVRLAGPADQTPPRWARDRIRGGFQDRGWPPVRSASPNGWLFAASVLAMGDEPIHEIVHEYGEPWAPAWVHVGVRADPAGRIKVVGDWFSDGWAAFERPESALRWLGAGREE